MNSIRTRLLATVLMSVSLPTLAAGGQASVNAQASVDAGPLSTSAGASVGAALNRAQSGLNRPGTGGKVGVNAGVNVGGIKSSAAVKVEAGRTAAGQALHSSQRSVKERKQRALAEVGAGVQVGGNGIGVNTGVKVGGNAIGVNTGVQVGGNGIGVNTGVKANVGAAVGHAGGALSGLIGGTTAAVGAAVGGLGVGVGVQADVNVEGSAQDQ